MPAAKSGLVRDLMTVGVNTCSPDTPVVKLARLILEKGIEAIVVLEPTEGHALGVVGQDELIRAYGRSNVQDLTAEEVMRDGVPNIPADIPLIAAAQIMQDLGVRALFIMHHSGGIEYPAGVITYNHLLRHLVAEDAEELSDLGVQRQRESPLQTFIRKRNSLREQQQKRLK